jgi:hypothetical protein
MNRTISFIMLAALACPAFATGNHPPPTPPKPPSTNNHNQQNQHQGQHQGQGQGQQQGQTAQGGHGTGIGVGIGQGGAGGRGGNSDATATGGRSNATGGDSRATGGNSSSGASSGSSSDSGVQGSGNSQLDASDRSSYRSESNFMVQPSLPGAAPALVAGGLLSVSAEPGCGPLQAKVRIPVRMLVKRKWQEVGFDEDLVPYRDANGNLQSFRTERLPDGTTLLIGNNVTMVGSVLGNASSSGVGAGGGNQSAYGQISIGGGNGQQQIGIRYAIRECVKDVAQQVVVKQVPRKVVKRKAVKRRPAQCVPQPAKVCPTR